MLFVSILTSDRSRDPELWATIWNGDSPPSINLIGAYNLHDDRRVFIWEGETVADMQFMDRFNEAGVIQTAPAADRTLGWRAAFAKDLEGIAERFRRSGGQVAGADADAAVELRRRGMEAPNRDAARAEARAWQRERAAATQKDTPG